MKKTALALAAGLLFFSCLSGGRSREMIYYKSDEPICVYLLKWDGTFADEPAMSFHDFTYFAEDNPHSGTCGVIFIFNEKDAAEFGRFTEANISEKASFFYAGEILVTAVINEPITGGELLITFPRNVDRDAFLNQLKLYNEVK